MKKNLIILTMLVLLLAMVLVVAPVAAQTAELNGTVLTTPANNDNINAGGLTMNITLTDDTWKNGGGANIWNYTDAEALTIINDMVAGDQVAEWTKVKNALIAATDGVGAGNNTAINRTSDHVVTITLPAPVGTYSIISNQTITVTVPGSRVLGDNSITASPAFNITAPPTFTSVDPEIGNTTGGTSVTIIGTNFISGGSFGVAIGVTPATSVVRVNATHITAVTPPGTAGAKDVVITNYDGQTGTGTTAYTYVTPPVFSYITPTHGTTVGGTAITITGTNFVAGGSLGVTINGTAATSVVRVDATNITAVTPASVSAGAKDIVITNGNGGTTTAPNNYTYIYPPTFTSIIPDTGTTAGGTAVMITGTNFTGAGSFGVTIGGTSATSAVWVNATHITAVTPAGTAGAKDVVITNNDGQIVTGTGNYTYVGPPTFTNITPAYGNLTGGTAVTINGTNFVTGSLLRVTIDGNPATSVVRNSATNITAVTPAGTAGAKEVVIRSGDGQICGNTGVFTYEAPPTFTSITPASGPTAGGTAVKIIGTNFVPGGSFNVTIGGIAATSITWNSATNITAVTPAGTAGAKDVVITNNHTQTATGTGAFTYIAPPTVTGITPSFGFNASSVAITNLTGMNFTAGATVKLNRTGFADIPGTSVTVVSPVKITCSFDLTGKTTGVYNVNVTNGDGQMSSNILPFTIYIPAPTITTVYPQTVTNGVDSWSVPFEITGTGYQDGVIVNITNGSDTARILPIGSPLFNLNSEKTKITFNANFTGQNVGSYNVTVTNPGTVYNNTTWSPLIVTTQPISDKIGLFRNGTVFLAGSNTPGGGVVNTFNYGWYSDKPVAGNWTGSGADTMGVLRNGVFYLASSNTNGGGTVNTFIYGQTADVPVAGHWTGGNADTVGVFRNGVFYLASSNTNGGGTVNTFNYGLPTDIPIAGDWDGDGITTVGIFRDGLFALAGSNTPGGGTSTYFIFGQLNDVPVVGDWNGDGKTEVGVFRNGMVYLASSNINGGGIVNTFNYGVADDLPVGGYWG